MSNYYKECQKMFVRLENIIDMSKKKKNNITINYLVYELTKTFLVGEKTIMKRLYLLQDIRQDFKIKNNEVCFNE